MHLRPRRSQPSINGDARAVRCVVSWRRGAVHLPAATHPSRNPGLELELAADKMQVLVLGQRAWVSAMARPHACFEKE
jgi:hypothetical protein